MDTPLINLHPENTGEDAPKLDLFGNQGSAVLSDEGIDNYALKYHVALGNDSPGVDQIKASLRLGNEASLRDWAVTRATLEDRQVRDSLIADYAKARPSGELQPGEREFLGSLSTADLKQPRDILERRFADAVVTMTMADDKSGAVDEAMASNSDAVDGHANWATRTIAQKEYAGLAAEKVKGMIGFMDEAKQYVPFYQWWQGVNAAPADTTESDSMLLGNVMEEQVKDMWLRDPEGFKNAIDDVQARAERGEINPRNAYDFLMAVQQFTPWDRRFGNIQSASDLIEVVPGVGLIGDLAVGGGKMTARIAGKVATRGAEKDIVKGVEEAANRSINWTGPDGKSYEFTPEDVPDHIVERELRGNLERQKKDLAKLRRIAERSKMDPERKAAAIAESENGVKKLQTFLDAYDARKAGNVDPQDVIKRDYIDPKTGEKITVDVPNTAEERAKGVIDAAVENAGAKGFDPVTVNVNNGRIEDAAIDGLTARSGQGISQTEIPKDTLGLGKDLANRIQSFFYPLAYLRNPGRMAQQAQDLMLTALRTSSNELLRAMSEGVMAQRVTREQLEAAMPAIKEEMRRTYHTADNAIIDTEWRVLHESENAAQVNYVELGIGRPDGTFFDSPIEALDTGVNVYKLKQDSFEVVQKGQGYFLRTRQAVDETNPAFRDILIDTDHKTPETAGALFTQYLRSGDAFMSAAGKANRKVAVHQISKIHEAVFNAAKDIGTISKREAKRLDKILELNRDTVLFKGTKDEVRGFWFKNVGDFEQAYKRMFNEYPSDKVTRAYFTYKNLMDFDYMVRNLKLYREKSRLGFQKIEFSVPVERTKPDGTVESFMQYSNKPIEGKFVDDVIQDGTDKRILIIDSETKTTKYIRSKTDGMADVTALKEKGYRLVQLVNPDQRPLKNLVQNDNLIQYVLTRDHQVSKLDYAQIPYREGGHVVVNANWKVSQPKIVTTSDGTKMHIGDSHFTFVSSETEAKFWAERMEKARKLLLQGDDGALKDYLVKYTPYKSVNEFKALFEAKTINGEVIDPTFQLDTPFVHVADRAGTNDAAKTYARDTLGKHFEGVFDTLDMPENQYRLLDKEFAGQKSDQALTVTGSDTAAWNFAAARQLSPLQTMQNSIATVSRDLALDNVQHQAAETFIQEFKDVLDIPLEKMRQDPMEAVLNPVFNRNADQGRVGVAKAQRLATLQFLGMRPPAAQATDWIKNKLLNFTYNYGGKGTADFVDDWAIPMITDPSRYLRATAFHLTMGFFNPIQLVLQAQTMAHAIAITGNPARVGSSLAATYLMTVGRVTSRPEVLEGLAKRAVKFGWKESEFKEMYNIVREQGLHIVGGEVGSLDTLFHPTMFKSKAGSFLEKGTMFFREGERMVRLNGFAIAYKEFRQANPTKVLDATDIGRIMSRADDLTLNMTSASNAAWQNGIFSIPTQFMGFQARLSEQILGKTLTGPERMRLVGTYSALYGVPVGASAALLWPFGEDIRQAALERGINIDEGATDVLMNGMLSVAVEAATGRQYNVSNRYGPGGLTVLRDFMNGDKDIFDIVQGASGSIISDAFTVATPLIADLASFKFDDVMLADAAHAFRGISSVSNVAKLLYAMRTGKLLSKNGTVLGPMDDFDAWVMVTSGLTRQELNDAFLKMDAMKDMKSAETELDKQFMRYARMASDLPPGSEERKRMWAKAMTFMVDRDPQDISKLYNQVIAGKDVQTQVEERFVKEGPVSTRDARNQLQNNQE